MTVSDEAAQRVSCQERTSKDFLLGALMKALLREKSKLWRRFMEGRRATFLLGAATSAPAAL